MYYNSGYALLVLFFIYRPINRQNFIKIGSDPTELIVFFNISYLILFSVCFVHFISLGDFVILFHLFRLLFNEESIQSTLLYYLFRLLFDEESFQYPLLFFLFRCLFHV